MLKPCMDLTLFLCSRKTEEKLFLGAKSRTIPARRRLHSSAQQVFYHSAYAEPCSSLTKAALTQAGQYAYVIQLDAKPIRSARRPITPRHASCPRWTPSWSVNKEWELRKRVYTSLGNPIPVLLFMERASKPGSIFLRTKHSARAWSKSERIFHLPNGSPFSAVLAPSARRLCEGEED